MKIYISASLINNVINCEVASALELAGHTVLLPENFCPLHEPHESFPEAIFRECVRNMEMADACILILDCFERDSSWEVGWFYAKGKPIIAFGRANLHILQDWMVKGALTALTTDSPAMAEEFRKDKVLSQKKVACDTIEKIANQLAGWIS